MQEFAMVGNIHLNNLLTLSADVFCIFDRNLKFIEVAGASGMPWGYEPAWLTGRPLPFLINRITKPDEPDEQDFFEQLSLSAPVKFECRLLANNNEAITVEWTLKWQPEQQVFYGVARTLGGDPAEGAGNPPHDQMGRIIESITDGLCTVDESWTITGWNKAAEGIVGKKRSELIGENLFEAFSRELTPAIMEVYQKTMTEKKIGNFEEFIPVINIWVGIYVYPIKSGIQIIFRDITESKLHRKYNELEKQVLKAIAGTHTPLTEVITNLLNGIHSIHPGMFCSVLKVHNGKLFNWSSPHLPASYNNVVEGTPIGYGQGCCGTAAYLKQDINVTDVQAGPLCAEFRQLAKEHGLQACFSLPFYDEEHNVLGTFAVYFKEARGLNRMEAITLGKSRMLLENVIQKKIATQKLIGSETRLKEAQMLAHIGNWQASIREGISSWSDEMFRIFGLSVNEITPSLESFLSFVHPEDKDSVLQQLKEAEEKRQGKSISFRIIRKDGQVRHMYSEGRYELDEHGNVDRIYGILQDITEKKKAILLVKRSEKKYRNLFNSSPLPMWVYDMETYRFLNVNNAAIRHYGYTREEFLSMTIKDIRPASEIERLEAELNKIRGTADFHEGIFKHCKKNGEVIDVRVQGNVIDFDGQEARLVLAIDVSAQVAYMNAIEEQNARLREIAWVQSHVVRAPLARIMALIDVLKDKDLSREDFHKFIEYLSASGQELDNVIKEIVERTQRLEMQ